MPWNVSLLIVNFVLDCARQAVQNLVYLVDSNAKRVPEFFMLHFSLAHHQSSCYMPEEPSWTIRRNNRRVIMLLQLDSPSSSSTKYFEVHGQYCRISAFRLLQFVLAKPPLHISSLIIHVLKVSQVRWLLLFIPHLCFDFTVWSCCPIIVPD